MFDEFLTTFHEADVLLLTDIYAASEAPIEGVTARKLVDGIRAMGHPDVTYVEDQDELLTRMVDLLQPGDLVLTLGAGDLNQFAVRLKTALEEKTA